jgi:hypothetical protein
LLKRCTAVFLAASCVVAVAKPKAAYQDAVLKNFSSERHQTRCASSEKNSSGLSSRGSGGGSNSASGRSGANGAAPCGVHVVSVFTVVADEHVYVLTPALLGEYAPTGLGRFLVRSPSLEGALPGTPVKMRSDGGDIYIKVGNRESEYKLVSAN